MNLELLKEKIPYQWRVQSVQNDKAFCVAYIDSRDVQEVLDKVCGPSNWQCDYKEVKGNLYCGIGIWTTDGVAVGWVWKWDCGTESNTEKEKGEASDSFKRAAVKWGVGRFLYDLDIVRLKTVVYAKNGKQYPADEHGNILWDGASLSNHINKLKPVAKPTDSEKSLLRALVNSADMDATEKEAANTIIDFCDNYQEFNKIENRLHQRQPQFDTIANPNQKDVNKHLKKVAVK